MCLIVGGLTKPSENILKHVQAMLNIQYFFQSVKRSFSHINAQFHLFISVAKHISEYVDVVDFTTILIFHVYPIYSHFGVLLNRYLNQPNLKQA